ncbi:MAG: SdpI family protein [Fusicatenibacter sp.]|nr:SdpI family protein [Fusicatenibacter sp.]
MWFWGFLFCCDLMTPVLMIVAGRMMWKHCPKDVNGVLGYRTKRSMKNRDTWKFAHEYCGKLWWFIGWVSFVLSVLIQIPFCHSNENVISIMGVTLCSVQCILLVGTIFLTERALKKKFDENGRRRDCSSDGEE